MFLSFIKNSDREKLEAQKEVNAERIQNVNNEIELLDLIVDFDLARMSGSSVVRQGLALQSFMIKIGLDRFDEFMYTGTIDNNKLIIVYQDEVIFNGNEV